MWKPANIISSAHVTADRFAKARQEVFLVTVGNLFDDAKCIHPLLLSNALRDQRECISTIYNQHKSQHSYLRLLAWDSASNFTYLINQSVLEVRQKLQGLHSC